MVDRKARKLVVTGAGFIGANLDLDIVADPDTPGDMRSAEDDAAIAQRGAGPDDGPWVGAPDGYLAGAPVEPAFGALDDRLLEVRRVTYVARTRSLPRLATANVAGGRSSADKSNGFRARAAR